MQVFEVHIGFVEDDDLAFRQPSADLLGTLVVMLASGIDDGKGGQEAVEPEAQVHLCCGLAPSVLRPVHAVGYELHHGRVHRVDEHL